MTHEERALNCDHQCSTCADNPALKSGLLKRWPIRLSLLGAANCIPYNSDILIAADCTAFACADFQVEYIKDRLTIIVCPLLEESEAKLTEIFGDNEIRSITVARMSSICCNKLSSSVKAAVTKSGRILPVQTVTIDPSGEVI